jgi:poly-gamma-glutamate synthesis protein (capsule biosynthesis protein)
VADSLMARTRTLLIVALFIFAISMGTGVAAVLVAQFVIGGAGDNFVRAQDTDIRDVIPVLYPLPLSDVRQEQVSLFVAGDVMLDRTVATRIRAAGDDLYSFNGVKDDPRFTEPDLRLLNLEGPVTAKRMPPVKEIDFQFDPRFANVLRLVGIDAVSQANNHAGDQGRAGFEESRRLLQEAGLLVFGDEVRDDLIALATSTIDGRRLAFVGFNETSDRIDDTVAEETMRAANLAGDTIIAYIHWGEEYRNRPTRNQEARARWLIDHGADIVIGAHPHWVQSISVYNGKPIFYSLGNFIFDQDWSVETRRGLALGLRISDLGVTANLYPIQIDASRPHFVEGEELASRLRDLASVSDAALTQSILQGEVMFPD